jgi:hypothetical protein
MAMDILMNLKVIHIINEKEVDYWPSWSTFQCRDYNPKEDSWCSIHLKKMTVTTIMFHQTRAR